jgi:predicted DNA-binding transcriptional regulator AlpA
MKRFRHHKDARAQERSQPDLFAAPLARAAPDRERTAADAKHPGVSVNQNGSASETEKPSRTVKPAPLVVRPANGLIRVREAAARLGLSKSTLDKMRCDGRGPRFVKITSKIVGYDPADLDAYAESRKRNSTSER